ncbi:MAG: hypothetical protein R3D28_22455 [Geminicoccaceae bacterium]
MRGNRGALVRGAPASRLLGLTFVRVAIQAAVTLPFVAGIAWLFVWRLGDYDIYFPTVRAASHLALPRHGGTAGAGARPGERVSPALVPGLAGGAFWRIWAPFPPFAGVPRSPGPARTDDPRRCR